ncbi:O-antigen ligase family protein [Paenibacillus kobensis]|uniref:O-antigen ligase family protein n=1 Tax=Paenibacillus kobensis TaxID=59841 RepID=UPI000FDB3CFF|nr:O-antigen ligase family protein [Paenibacillus kobensis]
MKNNHLSPKHPRQSEQPLLFVVFALFLGLWLLLFPYRAGLFNGLSHNFEKPILNAALYVGLLFAVVSVAMLLTRKQTGPTKAIMLSAWILPFCYWLSSFGAAAQYDARWLILINAVAAALFTSAAFVSRLAVGQRILEWFLVGTGYVIVLYGLLNVFGLAYRADALWQSLPGQFRLTSVLQYSNTYAALLIALFLVALYYVSHVKNLYWRAMHAFMLVPIFVSFMLTLSRAALLLLPLLVLCLLPFLRLSKQILLLLYMIVSIGASFIILSKIDSNMLEIATQITTSVENTGTYTLFGLFDKLSWTSWFPMLVVSLVLAALAWFVHEPLERLADSRLTRFTGTKWSLFAVPALLILLCALGAALVLGSSAIRGLLPPSIAERVENINFNQHSVLERGTFYKDAMKISADYPILGAGGGGWNALYQEYQNNPYSSAQAHNYIMQVLVETGWLGLLAHLALIIGILFLYIRGYIRHSEKRGSHIVLFILASSILVHSLLDFDMSYFYMQAIVFVCLGALSSVYSRASSPESASAKQTTQALVSKLPIVYPAILALLSIVLIAYTGQQLGANANYKKAVELASAGQPFTEVIQPLDKAIKSSPYNPDYALTAADWYMQVYDSSKEASYADKAGQLLDKMYKINPYNPMMLSTKYAYEKALGQEDALLATLEERIVKFKWSIGMYDDAMREYAINGWDVRKDKPELRDQRWKRVDELYEDVLIKIEELKKLPPEQLQGRSFDITPGIRNAMGLTAYGRGDYAKSIEWTAPVATGDLSALNNPNIDAATKNSIKNVIRVYLAALDATGQSNDALKSTLFALDPEQEKQLNDLIAGRN